MFGGLLDLSELRSPTSHGYRTKMCMIQRRPARPKNWLREDVATEDTRIPRCGVEKLKTIIGCATPRICARDLGRRRAYLQDRCSRTDCAAARVRAERCARCPERSRRPRARPISRVVDEYTRRRARA